MTLHEPPDDPQEGWDTCNRCNGSGLEMSKAKFEVYFVFDDEPMARTFMDAAGGSSSQRGIRRLPVQDGQLDTPFDDPES